VKREDIRGDLRPHAGFDFLAGENLTVAERGYISEVVQMTDGLIAGRGGVGAGRQVNL